MTRSPLPVLAELHARAREPSPIPKGKWKPIDARKFGYDVSVRPYVRTDFGAGIGGGTGVTGNYWARNKIGQPAFFFAQIVVTS